MGIAVMKRLRSVGTQVSFFETRKRSHICCAALLCGRFGNVKELRFKSENRPGMSCDELQVFLFAHSQEWHFQAAKRSDKRSSTMQEGVLLMLRNNVFRVGKVIIWAVLSNNEVELLIPRKHVFRLRNVQKCAVPSRK